MKITTFSLAFLSFCCCLPLGAASSDVADAAMKNDRKAVVALLQQKADANAAQADGATALHWAARWDDADMADQLLRAGAKVNAANGAGATPLFLACVNGSAAMIEKLVRGGADVNAPVLSHGETALMMASRSGNGSALKALLDHGAQVNLKDTLRGTTALMWAAEQGHASVLELLLARGADVNLPSAVLSPVKRRGLGFAPPAAGGVRPTGDPRGGLTALMFAVRQGSLESVRTLVAAKAAVNQAAVDGSSPLLVAVQNGNYAIADFLIEQGADVSGANSKGWSPLYLAVKNRNQEATAVPGPPVEGTLELITKLLDRGANPNVRINVDTEVHQGMTALWLKEAGATPLLRAALCGDLTGVRLLLAHKADPLIPTLDKTTPLMVAAGVGWADGMIREHSEADTLEVMKLILDAGASVTAANDHGITALHGAAYKGANKAVQLLVDRGADLAAQDKGEDYGFGVSTIRMTPLNWAEGVPIGMSSAIFHNDTVALLTRLMQERKIPVVSNAFRGQKAPTYSFGGGEPAAPENR